MLTAFNAAGVEYMLIGGMNYLLRHDPVLTFDVDVWINDAEGNRARCWPDVDRWRVLQETITWAEQQLPVRRNSPRRCAELQAAHNAAPAPHRAPAGGQG